MKEKKQFSIPKNYDKRFEWIPGISGLQHLVFIPSIGIDYVILQYTSFDFTNKIVFCVMAMALPWFLIGTKPVRENVSLYKHIYWKLKFMSRQRLFHYKKEGYKDVAKREIREEYGIKEGKEKRKTIPEGRTNKVKQVGSENVKDRSGFNTDQGRGARVTYNSRSENDSVSKGVGS